MDMNAKDKKLLQTLSNHPVHILNNEGEFSPSSFIPFCSFGEEFVGINVEDFDIPVCNIFKPKIYLNQLCYETNLQELKDRNTQTIGKQLERGLTLLLDYNEERQSYKFISKNQSLAMKSPNQNDDGSVSVYLDTISINLYIPYF